MLPQLSSIVQVAALLPVFGAAAWLLLNEKQTEFDRAQAVLTGVMRMADEVRMHESTRHGAVFVPISPVTTITGRTRLVGLHEVVELDEHVGIIEEFDYTRFRPHTVISCHLIRVERARIFVTRDGYVKFRTALDWPVMKLTDDSWAKLRVWIEQNGHRIVGDANTPAFWPEVSADSNPPGEQ